MKAGEERQFLRANLEEWKRTARTATEVTWRVSRQFRRVAEERSDLRREALGRLESQGKVLEDWSRESNRRWALYSSQLEITYGSEMEGLREHVRAAEEEGRNWRREWSGLCRQVEELTERMEDL